MARLLGLSGEQVDGIRPLFPKERGGKRVDDRQGVERHHPCPSEGAAPSGCKPSTTVTAAGETRVCLI